MTEEQTSPPPLTRRDFVGGPREWLLLLAMVSVTLLAGRALEAFPLLDAQPLTSFVIAGIVFLVTFAALAKVRRKVAPWGSRAPFLMWGGLLAFSVFAGFLGWSLVSFGNGLFDGAPPNQVRYTVVARYRDRSSYRFQVSPETASGDESNGKYWVDVTEEEWEAGRRGSTLLVDERPGFLGMPWVAGYELCRAPGAPC